MSSFSPIDAVVIGAGYAGVIAANRLLGSLTDVEGRRVRVSVVNPRPDFVERIRLHELAAGTREVVTVPLTEVLHEDATLIVGTVRLIDPDDRSIVVMTAHQEVARRYHYLIYAPGSHAAAPVPGSREHAFLHGDPDGAAGAAAAIGRTRGQRILVVGGVVAPDRVAGYLRMSCAAALPLGGHAAGTVLAALCGEQPTRLSVGFLLQCVSLGRRSGYVQRVRSDDTPRPFHLGGRLAALVEESICTMVLEAPRKERTRPGSFITVRGPKVAA